MNSLSWGRFEMHEERMKILQMLADGKITAEDAAKLLDAIAEPKRAAPPGAAIVDEVKRTVEDVIHAIPNEAIDDVRATLRETLREGREAAHQWRHWARRGWWGAHMAATLGGHEAAALFEDARATPATRLVVRNTRGDVRLTRSADAQLRVKARRRVWAADAREAERLAERLPIEIHEAGDVVSVEGPGARPFHERLRVDFDIAVPEALDVELHLVRGDATVEGLRRSLVVNLVKGEVRATDCAGVTVQSVSGDVRVDGSEGAVVARVIRGDVHIVGAHGDVTASTKRGDVAVRTAAAGRIEISTVRGDIELRAEAFSPGGGATVHTVNGDVALRLGPQARCRIKAMTVAGDITSTLPLQDVKADRRHFVGTLGAPEATVQISATRGDIALARLLTEPAGEAQAPA
jgi:hypothetical protein